MSFWRRLLGERADGAGVAEPEAVDHGPSIGEQLRERRTTLGLSFADGERDTRINRLYLEALEDNDFEALPAPVYARGFMRSYARYLGLDPDAAAAQVPRDLPRPRGLEPLPGLRAASSVTLPALTPGVRLLIILAAIVLAAVVVWFALRGGSSPQPALTIGTSTPVVTATVPPNAVPAGTTGAPGAGPAVEPVTAVPPFTPGTAPNFRGVERDVAVALAETLRLVPLVVEERNAAAVGRVFDQSPLPGTAVVENDIVTLFTSSGPGN
ncbi:MAG: helix-turn-helix domain-containing protein [Chloroflexi bacterium]|nr:helix-turn-helix domain-containing protein [Chloroflexota bacterium]